MLYESTKNLLVTIIKSVESGESPQWDDHVQSGRQCLYELHQMSHSTTPMCRLTADRTTAPVPLCNRAGDAIPHLKVLLFALRSQDREAAVASARAALVRMDGAPPIRPTAVPIKKSAVSRNQTAFLAACAQVRTVGRAAELAGVSRKVHYDWIARDPTYAALFAQAGQK